MKKSSLISMKKAPKTQSNALLEPINPISLDLERITDSIQCLQQLIPQTMNKDLIRVIYGRFGTKFNLSRAECNKFIMQHEQNNGISKNVIKMEEISQQELKALQQLHNSQNKIVARAFCLRDFGFAALQKEMQQECQTIRITEDNYECIISRVIIEALETLQAYLLKQGMIRDKSSKEERKAMIARAIQCRKMLAPQICEIFFKIIRGLYEIEPLEFVTKEQANILYKTFRRIAHAATIDPLSKQIVKPSYQSTVNPAKQPLFGLSVKQKNVQDRKSIKKQFKFQIHEIWTSSHEQLFLELYQRTPYLSMIRDKFQQIFCEHSQFFTVQSLKSILFRILRMAIKKFQKIIKQNQVSDFSPLTTLDDNRIKMIIYNEDFREARLLILEVYSKEYNLPLLVKAINRINLLVSLSKNNYSTKRDKQKYNESRKRVRERCKEFQLQREGIKNKCKNYNTWCPKNQLQIKAIGEEYVKKSESSSEASRQEPHRDNESQYLFYE